MACPILGLKIKRTFASLGDSLPFLGLPASCCMPFPAWPSHKSRTAGHQSSGWLAPHLIKCLPHLPTSACCLSPSLSSTDISSVFVLCFRASFIVYLSPRTAIFPLLPFYYSILFSFLHLVLAQWHWPFQCPCIVPYITVIINCCAFH